MPPKQSSPNGKLRVTVDGLNVRKSGSLKGSIVGSLNQGDIVNWLGSSADSNWCKIQKATLTGWSSHRFLVPEAPAIPSQPYDEIIQIAATSALAGYSWKN